MKILAFAASHRPESYNRKLVKLAAAYLAAKGAQVDFAEYSAFDMPLYNDALAEAGAIPREVRSFGERAAHADGILLSSPEYNWSYPGSIKTIIDWTSRLSPNPLAGKTALLMSATPGNRGGITGLNHLKTPLESLQLFVFPRVFPLSDAKAAFDADGNLRDEKIVQRLNALLDEYFAFARKFTGG